LAQKSREYINHFRPESIFIANTFIYSEVIRKPLIFFVSKDENLTKAHIKYLEGKLIEMTKAADRFELENTNANGASLPESDTADMDVFLSKVEQLLSEGTVTKEADRLVFTKDYEFSSPSAAASVIHGGHANGLIAWKNDKGVTLKDLEQKEMANNTMDSDEE
jgi:hypothetical protein